MQPQPKTGRHVILVLIFLLALTWALASAEDAPTYPNGDVLAGVPWLAERIDRGDAGLTIVDVRRDKYFDGRLIPGAIRMPWTLFRHNDLDSNTASRFIGTQAAQKVLGEHGIGRTDTVVLYDAVARDGGATASYLFWILEVLGHQDKRILDGGIDAWQADGQSVVSKPAAREPLLYQALPEEIRRDQLIGGDFIYNRLADPYYQIIDVRSPAEYNGKARTRGLQGEDLKLGHIPMAVNIDYTSNWIDSETKRVKSYHQLQQLYRGLDPDRAVIVYCNSGRRSSFSYFILTLMGVRNVYTYEASWKEWGLPEAFYPVETISRSFSTTALPGASTTTQTGSAQAQATADGQTGNPAAGGSNETPKSGYVSCGG